METVQWWKSGFRIVSNSCLLYGSEVKRLSARFKQTLLLFITINRSTSSTQDGFERLIVKMKYQLKKFSRRVANIGNIRRFPQAIQDRNCNYTELVVFVSWHVLYFVFVRLIRSEYSFSEYSDERRYQVNGMMIWKPRNWDRELFLVQNVNNGYGLNKTYQAFISVLSVCTSENILYHIYIKLISKQTFCRHDLLYKFTSSSTKEISTCAYLRTKLKSREIESPCTGIKFPKFPRKSELEVISWTLAPCNSFESLIYRISCS